MLPTDWSAPASSVLTRLSDRRVQQHWDPNHVLATRMKNDARAPQPVQDCCVRSGILWDLAAVYPPVQHGLIGCLRQCSSMDPWLTEVEAALASVLRTSLLLLPTPADGNLETAAVR